MAFSTNHKLDITSLTHRYVCGGGALTSLRSVSRLRLLLVHESIVTNDPAAAALHRLINNYRRAKKAFLASWPDDSAIGCLQSTHKQLETTNKKFGVFRTTEAWIGQNRKDAFYVPPIPEKNQDFFLFERKNALVPRQPETVLSQRTPSYC